MTDYSLQLDQPAANAEPSAGHTTLRGLRANCFGVVMMLLVQFGLGMWVNLYAELPDSDHGANPASGIGRAISKGPIGLSVHAVLGIVLFSAATAALVRAIRVGRRALIVATSTGLTAIFTAAFSGARFVGHGDNASSMSMAVAAGVAIASYAFVLFISADDAISER